jgi:hypothetical protein
VPLRRSFVCVRMRLPIASYRRVLCSLSSAVLFSAENSERFVAWLRVGAIIFRLTPKRHNWPVVISRDARAYVTQMKSRNQESVHRLDQLGLEISG